MKIKYWLSLVFLLLFINTVLFGQSNKDKAKDIGDRAVKVMDDGNVDEAVKMLQEAEKLDPTNFAYPYEIAYSYNLKKDYKHGIEILEKIKKYPNANDRVYQMLGNMYDESGDSAKAITAYKSGLKEFPKSGSLYYCF